MSLKVTKNWKKLVTYVKFFIKEEIKISKEFENKGFIIVDVNDLNLLKELRQLLLNH